MTEENNQPSRRQALVDSRWFLLFVALLVMLVGSISYYLIQPDLPELPERELKLFALALLVGIILAAPWAALLVDWLYTPNSRFIHRYNAATDEFELWELSLAEWRDLDVDEELHQLNAKEPVYQTHEFDPDENTASGHWRGSASDLQLVESREAVKEVRGDLEQLAREGLAIRTKQSAIVRAAVADIVMEFVADFEEETTYSGDQIQKRVESALDDLDDQDDSPDQTPEPDDENKLLEALDESEPSTNGNQ